MDSFHSLHEDILKHIYIYWDLGERPSNSKHRLVRAHNVRDFRLLQFELQVPDDIPSCFILPRRLSSTIRLCQQNQGIMAATEVNGTNQSSTMEELWADKYRGVSSPDIQPPIA